MEVGDYYLTEIQKPAKGYGLEIDKTTGKAAIHKETIKKDKTTTASYEEPVDITKVYVKRSTGQEKRFPVQSSGSMTETRRSERNGRVTEKIMR